MVAASWIYECQSLRTGWGQVGWGWGSACLVERAKGKVNALYLYMQPGVSDLHLNPHPSSPFTLGVFTYITLGVCTQC